MALASILLVLAVCALLHAGFSTINYQSLVLLDSGVTTDDVPVDVVIEAGFALVAGLVGALLSTDKIQPLLSGSHEFSGGAPTLANIGFKPVSHRGAAVQALKTAATAKSY